MDKFQKYMCICYPGYKGTNCDDGKYFVVINVYLFLILSNRNLLYCAFLHQNSPCCDFIYFQRFVE